MKKRWLPVCRGCLRQLIASPRSWAVLIVTILYIDGLMDPLHLMLKTEGLTISVSGLMTYLLNDSAVTAFVALGCLVLLFDVPCADELQRYLMLRTGRKSWAKGQIAYCIGVSAIYLLAFTIVAALYTLPYPDFSMDWSSGIRFMVDEGGFMLYDSFLEYDVWLPRAYSALAAWGLQMALHLLMLVLLSLILMNINLLIDRRIGFAVVTAPLFFDLMVQEYFRESVYILSPLTLCRLSGLDYGDQMGRPSLLAAFLALGLASLAAGCLFVRGVKNMK